MKIVVIDGQGGRMGQMFIERMKKENLPCQMIAVGTNAIATSAMIKAGADVGATGENAVCVNARSADLIVGPIGILCTDSLYGEVTEKMAVAIGRSEAEKILFPVSKCSSKVVGCANLTMSQIMDEACEMVKEVLGNRSV